MMTQILHFPDRSTYCAYDDDGILIGRIRYLRGSGRVMLTDLHVDKHHRRSGVATALLARIHHDHPDMRLEPGWLSTDALGLYQALLARDPRASVASAPVAHMAGTGFM